MSASAAVSNSPDEQAPLEGRFLAAEVLFERDLAHVARVGVDKVAAIYAQALAGNLTGYANSWGLLWEHDGEGPVGARFGELGKYEPEAADRERAIAELAARLPPS